MQLTNRPMEGGVWWAFLILNLYKSMNYKILDRPRFVSKAPVFFHMIDLYEKIIKKSDKF